MTTALGHLFCCEYSSNKVAVFSLADPRNPQLVHRFSVGSQPRHIDVVGRYAFVCCHGAAKIEVYDISNPTGEGLVGSITTDANPKMFQILGDEIFVACFGTNKVQKFTYSLPVSGLVGFSSFKTAEATVSSGPLCLAVNGAGLVAVCGLNTANINLLGSSILNSINTYSVGGAGHATCSWVNKTQLLVTDSTNDRLYSINYNDIFSPATSGYADTSPNPEQIEIVGNRCYVPSLTNPGETSYLDCFDITNALSPVRYKSVELSVTGAGFTAYSTDEKTGYLYVNGHFSPYNIDIVEIPEGPNGRTPLEVTEYANIKTAGISQANVASFSPKYVTKVANYTVNAGDFLIRVGQGAAVTLPDPSGLPDGKVIIIENVSTITTSIVSNSFSGVPSLYLYPGDTIVLAAQQFSGAYQWDVVTRFTPTTRKYSTKTTNYSATSSDDIIRVGLGADVALPNPADMPGKVITVKNVHNSTSSDITNAFAGYSGTLAPGEGVTLVSMDFLGSYQWDAISSF